MRKRARRNIILVFTQAIVIYIVWKIFVEPTRVHSQLPEQSTSKGVELSVGKAFSNSSLDQKENDKEADYPDACTTVFLLFIPSTQADAVQNVLLRKALTSKLNIALPQPNVNIMCFPQFFMEKCPMNHNEAPFDMILHQLRYDKKPLKTMLKDDAKHIVLLRHPVAHLQASYYDNDWSDYVTGRPFRSFIRFKYHEFAKTFDFEKNLPYRNIQLFLLGLQPGQNEQRAEFEYKIKQISNEFHLIMFQEFMLESLVLLKYELNWADEELAMFSLHSRPENFRLEELTEEVNDTIIHYNEGDMRMYEVLLEKFHQRIHDFGIDRMKEEKNVLQYAINKETEHCLHKSEEEMRVSLRRTELRLSWDGEGDRYCHFHVSQGYELTNLFKMDWEKKQRKKLRGRKKGQ